MQLFHLLTKATKWWTNTKPRCSKYAASPSPLAFLSLRKMQCSSLMWAPLKTISCRLSASAWPTLKQERPFGEGEHHSHIGSHFESVAENKRNLWNHNFFKAVLFNTSVFCQWYHHLLLCPWGSTVTQYPREIVWKRERGREGRKVTLKQWNFLCAVADFPVPSDSLCLTSNGRQVVFFRRQCLEEIPQKCAHPRQHFSIISQVLVTL